LAQWLLTCYAILYQSHNVLDGVGNHPPEGGCGRGTYSPLRVGIFEIVILFVTLVVTTAQSYCFSAVNVHMMDSVYFRQ